MKLYIVYSIAYAVFSLNIRNAETACGRRLVDHIEGLIRDGFTTHPGDWPWHAAIFVSTNAQPIYTCGGSLINGNSVLTAAHCVHQDDGLVIGSERFWVSLGTYDLRTFLPDQHNYNNNQRSYKVYEVIPHADYSEANFINDIAMLRLSAPVTFTKYIQPICLWNEEQRSLSNVVNQIGTVIGWGITEDGQISDTIKAANIPVLSHQQCLNSDPQFFNELAPGNFCGAYKNGTTLCQGDSGGSLSFLDNQIYHIRGIVSYYKRNERYYGCNPREFVVFTDVAAYLPWIESNIAVSTVPITRKPEFDIPPWTPPNKALLPQVTLPTTVPFPQVTIPTIVPWQQGIPANNLQWHAWSSWHSQQTNTYNVNYQTTFNGGGGARTYNSQQTGSNFNSQNNHVYEFIVRK